MTDKNAKNENSKIRIMTFFPPFIILVAFLVLSLVDQETFLGVINNINNWIIKNLGWAAKMCIRDRIKELPHLHAAAPLLYHI